VPGVYRLVLLYRALSPCWEEAMMLVGKFCVLFTHDGSQEPQPSVVPWPLI
jgi:hypothetical protein